MEFPSLPPCPESNEQKGAWLDQVGEIARAEARAARRLAISLAWARLVTFAGFLASTFLLVQDRLWALAPQIACIILFSVCVSRYQAARTLGERLALLIQIATESRRRVEGDTTPIIGGRRPEHLASWATLTTARRHGEPCQELSQQELDDLDVFGEPLSLFGLLNRCSTPVGEACLVDVLTHLSADIQAINARQQAVAHLAERDHDRLGLLTAAATMRRMHGALTKFHETVAQATPLPNPRATSIIRVWGLAGPVALVMGLAGSAGWLGLAVGWMPLVTVIIINAILMPSFLKGVRQRIRPWLDLGPIVELLLSFARDASATLPKEGRLGELRRCFEAVTSPACLPALRRRIPLIYLGLSGFLHTIIDVLTFWDLQVLWLLERPYLRHKRQLLAALGALGECEVDLCLACFAAEQRDAAWPAFSADQCHLRIIDGRHPLISHQSAVTNTVRLGGEMRSWIITGSNMSGKSTFLRMAGASTLLAHCGGAVSAKKMELSPLTVLTDLRIRDDLSRQESYFLAEVRQVRRMVEAAAAGRGVLCLIDEPFRGTNSMERVAAAKAVLMALIRGGGLHLIATHDAALAALDCQGKAENHHFTEAFESDQLVFDYKLRPGAAKGRSALKVLQAERFPAEVIADAKRFLTDAGEPPQ